MPLAVRQIALGSDQQYILRAGDIAAIALGSILGVIAIIAVIFICVRKRSRSRW